MRVLFASTQGAGHFGPLIPLIDAAGAIGHETLVVDHPREPAHLTFDPGEAPQQRFLVRGVPW